MRYQQDTVERVRSIMGPGNPVPGGGHGASARDGHEPGRQEVLDRVIELASAETTDTGSARRPGPPARRCRPPHRSTRARRVAAPLGAALAVGGLIAGLTFASQSPQKPHSPGQGPATGAPAAADRGMPRFYVTMTLVPQNGSLRAQVHSSQTGQLLSRLRVPGTFGTNPNITSVGSDRTYLVDATRVGLRGQDGVTALYRLRLSADGRSTTLTRLPVNLLPAGSPDVVDGMAVSPDKSKLAVALQVYKPGSYVDPRGEILVYSLTGGPTQTWTAPDVVAAPWNPVWTAGNSLVTFVWQYGLRGTSAFTTGGSQIRELDTSARLPGRDLLASSQVVLQGGGKVGFIQAAYGRTSICAAQTGVIRCVPSVYAATYRVTSIHGSGTARVRLALLSPSGAVIKVYARHTYHYANPAQEGKAVASCQVLGVDVSGQHALVYCPAFGRVDHGRFTPLAGTAGIVAAVW